MGAIGWIVVLAFVVAITIIIYKVLHSDPEPEPKPDPVETISREKKMPTYVTVYEFNPKKNMKICCCCDGENALDAHKCCICGEMIDV